MIFQSLFSYNKSFGQLPNKLYLPKKFIFLKTLNSEFSDIDVQFTDQKTKPLEKEDKISIALVIN